MNIATKLAMALIVHSIKQGLTPHACGVLVVNKLSLSTDLVVKILSNIKAACIKSQGAECTSAVYVSNVINSIK